MSQRLCLLLLPLLLACRSSLPDKVLPPAQMQSAMWDIMRADEMANYYGQRDSSVSLMKRRAQYYGEVFRVHRTTEEDFKRSLHYYELHPSLLKEVLDSLQSRGERLQKADTANKTFTPPVDPSRGAAAPVPSLTPADSLKIRNRRLQKTLGNRHKLKTM